METNGTKTRTLLKDGIAGEPVPRRRLLGWLVGIINIGVGASILAPALGFVMAPLKRRQEPGRWVPVLDAAELEDGQMKAVTYQLEVQDGYMLAQRKYSVYLHRKGDQVLAYDPSCPHLGCHVEYKDKKKRFVCPCHGGVFDEAGNRVSGPPPRGLMKIAAKIEDGQIKVYRG